MIESITAVFKTLSTAAGTLKAFKELIKNNRGNSRALLEEIKENAGLCWLVAERGTDPLKIVPELATDEFNKIIRTEFQFNSMKRRKIKSNVFLEQAGLASFKGKNTEYLVENIYDRIKELKRIYRVDKNNQRIRWKTRIFNLQKRMLLLIIHLSS